MKWGKGVLPFIHQEMSIKNSLFTLKNIEYTKYFLYMYWILKYTAVTLQILSYTYTHVEYIIRRKLYITHSVAWWIAGKVGLCKADTYFEDLFIFTHASHDSKCFVPCEAWLSWKRNKSCLSKSQRSRKEPI